MVTEITVTAVGFQLTMKRDNIIQNIIIHAKFHKVWASHLTKYCKIASIEVCSFVTTVVLDCSSSVDHGEDSYKVPGQWIDEVQQKRVSWVCIQGQKGENVRGPLKIGEYVTTKTKSRIWKAVVVQ